MDFSEAANLLPEGVYLEAPCLLEGEVEVAYLAVPCLLGAEVQAVSLVEEEAPVDKLEVSLEEEAQVDRVLSLEEPNPNLLRVAGDYLVASLPQEVVEDCSEEELPKVRQEVDYLEERLEANRLQEVFLEAVEPRNNNLEVCLEVLSQLKEAADYSEEAVLVRLNQEASLAEVEPWAALVEDYTEDSKVNINRRVDYFQHHNRVAKVLVVVCFQVFNKDKVNNQWDILKCKACRCNIQPRAYRFRNQINLTPFTMCQWAAINLTLEEYWKP